MIVTSMFYTREEQTRRVGYWCPSDNSFLVAISQFYLLLSRDEWCSSHFPRASQLRPNPYSCKPISNRLEFQLKKK